MTPSASLGERTLRRVRWRLLPFLGLLYVVSYLDRVNVSFAKLTMDRAIGIDDATYALGAGIFFIGYFLFEIPSNLILERVGARRWIARIMVTWGVISAATAFVSGTASFVTMRFLLGLAEAGFFPGILLYLTYWFPATNRAKVVGLFMVALPVSGLIGSPMAGALMQINGLGLQGWQWLFILEGIPAVKPDLGVARLRAIDIEVVHKAPRTGKRRRSSALPQNLVQLRPRAMAPVVAGRGHHGLNAHQLREKPSISRLAQSSVCAMGSPLTMRTTILEATACV